MEGGVVAKSVGLKISLAKVIRKHRIDQRLSQPELAEKAGVAQSTVSATERMKVSTSGVTFGSVIKIAKGLGMKTSALVEEAEAEKEQGSTNGKEAIQWARKGKY